MILRLHMVVVNRKNLSPLLLHSFIRCWWNRFSSKHILNFSISLPFHSSLPITVTQMTPPSTSQCGSGGSKLLSCGYSLLSQYSTRVISLKYKLPWNINFPEKKILPSLSLFSLKSLSMAMSPLPCRGPTTLLNLCPPSLNTCQGMASFSVRSYGWYAYIGKSNKFAWTRKMAQWAMCLLNKHEELDQDHWKSRARQGEWGSLPVMPATER